MNNIREFFDSIADQWHNDLSDIKKIESLIDLVGIKVGDDVLDVGCGKGVITPILYQKSQKKVIAMDLSKNMIEGAIECHSDNKDLQFICGDFLESGYNNMFDEIVIFNAYPHFLDIEKLSNVVYNALKGGGRLAIIHSLSKEELNTHHKQHALKVSRPLESADVESKKFKAHFTTKMCLDTDDSYLILLEVIK
ncbi:MAG: methyltransferase domain-containing protein [Clostridia bacterium]|nr:methyltransferase domain-containing protein [Clostridia bacterium]